MNPIPIMVAEEIARDFDAAQVVVWACDDEGAQHVTTFGTDLVHKQLAADAGNRVRRAAGWPEELCKAKPNVLEKLDALIAEARNWTLHDEDLAKAVREYDEARGALCPDCNGRPDMRNDPCATCGDSGLVEPAR